MKPHIVLLLLLGCGGKQPSDPMLTPTLPEPAAGATGDHAPTTPAEGSASPVREGGLSPAVVSAVQSIPLFVNVRGLFLDYRETFEASEIIATWARAEGLTIVPPKRTVEIMRRALLGQHVTTGKACGAPLFEFEAVERWKTELAARGKLEVGVDCSPGCVMQVAVSIGTGGQGGTEFFAAPFDPTRPWRQELAARLPTIVDNGGHGRHGHLNNPVETTGIPRDPNVADVIFDREAKAGVLDANETAAATRCVATDHFASVLVHYDGTGKLAGCDPSPEFRAGATECVCRAIAGHSGRPNSRERIEARSPFGGEVKTKGGLRVRAHASPAMISDPATNLYKAMTTDPAIEMWSAPEYEELSPCFADASGATKLGGRVTLAFDAIGKATKATVIATTGTFTAAQQSCLRDVFLTVRAPCPSAAGAQATAELAVTFDKPD